MEQGAKKAIMVVVIVVCLATAGIIVVRSRRPVSSIEQLTGTQWLKCTDESCGYAWEVPAKEYHKWAQENLDPVTLSLPGYPCPKCGKNTAQQAYKCPKCGEVFFGGQDPTTFADTCPKCGYSQIKVDRLKAAGKPVEEDYSTKK